MTKTTVPTYAAEIFVGLRKGYSDSLCDYTTPLLVIGKYCDSVGLCVSVTETTFVYKGGQEPGLIVGLINYPRFPSTPDQIREHALKLAEMLLEACDQLRVSVVTPRDTVMLER